MMIEIMNNIDLCLPTSIQVFHTEHQNNKIKSQCKQSGHFLQTGRFEVSWNIPFEWKQTHTLSVWQYFAVQPMLCKFHYLRNKDR